MDERFDNELERLLADRLDGDLTPEQAVRLDALLGADAGAAREAVELEQVDRLVRAWGEREADVDFAALRRVVSERIRLDAGAPRGRARVIRLWPVVMPFAAAALLAIAMMVPWSTTSRGPVANSGGDQGAKPPVTVAVAYHRAVRASGAHVEVRFSRSAELTEQYAARDAAERTAPGLAAASSGARIEPLASSPVFLPPM
jgi:anti-sigma factor RsiW